MDINIFAYIPEEYQRQNIQWAIISPDSLKTGGIFLFLCQGLTGSCLYDFWFENLEIAKEWATENYGIKVENWRTKESLDQDGIHIFDEM